MAPTITNQWGDKITVSDKISLHSCPSCFIVHGIPVELEKSMLANPVDASCYCPNGHQWHFTGEPEEKKLKRLLANETALAERRSQALELERKAHSATKGQLTKTKKRIAGGACPSCNRTFANVERHMATQHPDFSKS
jgi:hypothetical protein